MFFKRKQSEAQRRMNALWELYDNQKLKSISFYVYCLCDYEAGVGGEGHYGWFFNCEETAGKEELKMRIDSLQKILPGHLFSNLEKAYSSYCTKETSEVCEAADEYFYNHEQEVIDILQKHADQFAF